MHSRSTALRLDSFDRGDYQKAVEQTNLARNIVKSSIQMTIIMQEKSFA